MSLALVPMLGLAYFPRTDPGQFVINIKAPTGTRVENTEQEVKESGGSRAGDWWIRTTFAL